MLRSMGSIAAAWRLDGSPGVPGRRAQNCARLSRWDREIQVCENPIPRGKASLQTTQRLFTSRHDGIRDIPSNPTGVGEFKRKLLRPVATLAAIGNAAVVE